VKISWVRDAMLEMYTVSPSPPILLPSLDGESTSLKLTVRASWSHKEIVCPHGREPAIVSYCAYLRRL